MTARPRLAGAEPTKDRPTPQASGHHRLRLATDGAREDFDSHTRLPGQISVKRTVPFDGTLPVHPLSCGSRGGEGLLFTGPDARGPHPVIVPVEDRDSRQGPWMPAGGALCHVAFDLADEANQGALKARIEAMGFTDVSELKDRDSVRSMHLRSPGGALVELAWTLPEGWAKDEAPGAIGRSLVVPPWFEHRRAAPMEGLEGADVR